MKKDDKRSIFDEDMDRIARANQPSMVPQWDEEREKAAEEAPPPDVREVISDRAAQLRLIRLVNSVMAFKRQKAEAAKAEKPIVGAIKKILSEWEVGRVMVDGNKINYFNVPRKTIKADKLTMALLSLGMKPKYIEQVIADSTTVTNSATLKITLPDEEEDEE